MIRRIITINEENIPAFETKDFYFTDFGLQSKSAVLPHQVMTEEQKKTVKKIGAGVAAVTAVTAVGAVIKKIFKKK